MHGGFCNCNSLGITTGSIFFLAFYISIAYFIHFALTIYFLVWKVFSITPLDYLKKFIPMFVAAIVAAVVSETYRNLINNSTNIISIAIRVSLLALTYTLVCVITKQINAITVFRDMRSMKGEEN